MVYPFSPGTKEQNGAAFQAAVVMRACSNTLQQAVLDELKNGSGTSDELAARIGASVLAIRPRISELIKMGLIQKTDERRPNASGLFATVVDLV